MASKPKPGLTRAVRTYASSASHIQSQPLFHQSGTSSSPSSIHHSSPVVSSSSSSLASASSGAERHSFQNLGLSPSSYSLTWAPSVGERVVQDLEAGEGGRRRRRRWEEQGPGSGRSSRGWAHPSTTSFHALLPPLDQPTPSFPTFDNLYTWLGDSPIVRAYRSPTSSLSTLHSPLIGSIRSYTSSSRPSRNASTSYHPKLPPEFFYEGVRFPHGRKWTDESQPDLSSSPPPLPPSESSNAQVTPSTNTRLAETDGFLSTVPMVPLDADGGGSGAHTPRSSFGSPRTLSPAVFDETLSITQPKEDPTLLFPIYASRLVFNFGASGLAKDRPIVQPTRTQRNAGKTPPPRPRAFPILNITAPPKLDAVSIGEDSYFASPDGICVADGVGGWAAKGRAGADAGRFSRLLAHYCHMEVRAWWGGAEEYCEEAVEEKSSGWWSRKLDKRSKDDETGLMPGLRRRRLDPVEIMQRGFEKCLSCVLTEGVHGSSTCILALLHHSTLRIANLGDCSLLVIRKGEIVCRTKELQHGFNFPFQVGTHQRDEPMKDAERIEVEVEENDIVLVGSDGLMDNLYDEDVLDVLELYDDPAHTSTATGVPILPSSPSKSGLSPFSPQKVADALCKKARAISEELNATTPFMEKAIEEGIDFVGGKKDDITVVVGVIGKGRVIGQDASLNT